MRRFDIRWACLLPLVITSGCASDDALRESPYGRHRVRIFDRDTRASSQGAWPIRWTATSDASIPTLRARGRPVSISDLGSFHEALVSWNIDLLDDEHTGATIECRVARADDSAPGSDAAWSPFLELGSWGEVPDERAAVYEFDGGKVATDFFTSTHRFDRIEVRLNAFGTDPSSPLPTLSRLAVCVSQRLGNSRRNDEPRDSAPPTREAAPRLPVPFRSQTDVPEIGHRICSPTSTSMVLAYRGVNVPPATVAGVAYDHAHEIYGNWPRNVQAAYSLGVPGYLTRFSDWPDVERTLAAGQPLVISVRVREGELRGAPYASTNGHLLVVCGFADNGDVEVNDPAASSPETGQLAYRRRDLETVWFGQGGTAYVFLPPIARR